MAFYRNGLSWAIIFLATNGVWAASSDTIMKACSTYSYREFCISSLSRAPGAVQADLTQLSVIAVDLCIEEAKPVSDFFSELRERNPNFPALEFCTEKLQDTRYQLNRSKTELKQLSNANLMRYVHDVQAWLSGAETNQYTCPIALQEALADENLVSTVKVKTDKLTMLIDVALAVVNKLEEQGHI